MSGLDVALRWFSWRLVGGGLSLICLCGSLSSEDDITASVNRGFPSPWLQKCAMGFCSGGFIA